MLAVNKAVPRTLQSLLQNYFLVLSMYLATSHSYPCSFVPGETGSCITTLARLLGPITVLLLMEGMRRPVPKRWTGRPPDCEWKRHTRQTEPYCILASMVPVGSCLQIRGRQPVRDILGVWHYTRHCCMVLIPLPTTSNTNNHDSNWDERIRGTMTPHILKYTVSYQHLLHPCW